MPCLVSSGHGYAPIAGRIGFGSGHELGMQHVFHQLCRNIVRRYLKQTVLVRTRCWSRPPRVRNVIRLFVVALAGALLAACAQSSSVTRNSEFVSPSRQASLQHNRTASLPHQQTCRIRKKAYPVRVAPPCGRDTDRFAGSCQLLYRGNTDRERRKVRYARFDRRSSDVAIWHKVARDECRQRTVRDSSGQ